MQLKQFLLWWLYSLKLLEIIKNLSSEIRQKVTKNKKKMYYVFKMHFCSDCKNITHEEYTNNGKILQIWKEHVLF